MKSKVLLPFFLLSLFFANQAIAGQRHWVGNGTGNGKFWDRTANWSLTQGGSGGVAVPTASDDVLVDGGGNLQVNTAAVCLSFNQSVSGGTKDFTNGSTLTVGAGGVTITGGILLMANANNSITVAGNWTQSGGTFTATNGAVIFNGSTAQTLSGTSQFADLTINNANGVSLSNTVTVNGTLTLTSGAVSTSSNTLIISSTGSVSRTSGWVNGKLQKQVPTGATSRTFEIGDAATFAPVTVSFGNVTTAGNLVASTVGTEHPSIVNSKIDASKSVNRYWTLTNAGVVFNNYSATFNFVAGDLDAGANTANFIVDRFNGSSWSAPTTGTQTATSTQATGLTTFSDFAIGEAKTITINASAGTNGTISPSGPTVVVYGGSQAYTIAASANYHINDVLVDGGSVGAVASYTFNNVTTNHTISASFAINTYTLDVTATNGTVAKNPDQASYNHGTTVDLMATPAVGYHFVDRSGDASGSANPLTVTMDGNKTITANFAINTYTLVVSATNGTVAKNPDQASYNHGTTVDLTATPAVGYHFVDWSGDASGSANPLTVTMDGNKTITANFAINTYNITSTAGAGGSINPAGVQSVNYGGSQHYTISPDLGYHLQDLLVDNVHVDSTTGYTFTNVTTTHTIEATFGLNTYNITATAGAGGAIVPTGVLPASFGENIHFTILPDPGYHLTDLLVDNVHVDSTTGYTFVNITTDHTIEAQFGINQYILTASVVGGGLIAPSGSVSVNHGDNKQFTLSPNTGYHLADLLVDNIHQDSTTSYTFTSVTGNHTIEAKFAIDTFTISASASAGGSLAPSGTITVNYGDNKRFTVSVNAGYHFIDLLVDNLHVDSTTSYTFMNVTANHTIHADFAINSYQLAASAGTGGTITPSGTVAANYGEDKAFAVAPNGGYHFADLLVDNIHVDSTASYTFHNVTTNHTIAASFAPNAPTLNGVTPPSGYRGQSVDVVLTGTNFINGVSTVNASAGISVTSMTVHNLDSIYATILVASDASLGAHPLSITNAPLGGASGTVAFTVLNRAPSAFALALPVKGDSVQLYTNPKPITFSWHPSVDLDGDTLTYTLSFPGTAIADTATKDTTATMNIAGSLTPNTVYRWIVVVTDGHATVAAADTFTFRTSTIVLDVKDKKGRIPTEYALYQNYPNPFNPSTIIEFDLPQRSVVSLTVYNLLGQEVTTLIQGEEMEMGVQTVTFGEADLTSGIYFYRITAEGTNGKIFSSVKRMMLLK
ncbi:MAG: T9SS type A sorting domain-containing protein [Ignavibacteriae bacterium]|nr:T9SS type A sorting domain-containing protein [Ignavibacteriota bacterium]